MDALVRPGTLTGEIRAISSKSIAHRLLILSVLSGGTTTVVCDNTSDDITTTIQCLEAMGAQISPTRMGFRVIGLPKYVDHNKPRSKPNALLDCGESGSTLRFLLPVACALGQSTRFTGSQRLAERPLSPLHERLSAHGCILSPAGYWPLEVGGQLRPGKFTLPGNISSQFVSGLLLAAPLLDGPSEIYVMEPVQSTPYITMTTRALATFGVIVDTRHDRMLDSKCVVFTVDPHKGRLITPHKVDVEGDWSNAAFWLAAGAIGTEPITVSGLNLGSVQGDRTIMAALAVFGAHVTRGHHAVTVRPSHLRSTTIDVSDFPDLVPPLAAVAACARGTTRLTNASRLRLKESDRLKTVAAALDALGVEAAIEDDDLLIIGNRSPKGGIVDSANDHRIAMMSTILATCCTGESCIKGAQCTAKSYPSFFDDFTYLGGHVTYIRDEV